MTIAPPNPKRAPLHTTPRAALALVMTLATAACSLTPPTLAPEDRSEVRVARAMIADAEAGESALHREREVAGAELERIAAELAKLDAPGQEAELRYAREKLAFERYENSLESASAFAEECLDIAPLTVAQIGSSLAAYLGEFVAQPERDAALRELEGCRKTLEKAARKQMKSTLRDLQVEFAETVEDTFDENNPYSQGDLDASVKGTTLAIRMRGNFEGRARHSQDQVDDWCVQSGGLFTKITLQNAHGTFTCVPDATPRELIDSILADNDLSTPWFATGNAAIPTPPAPLPPPTPKMTLERQELVAQAATWADSVAEFDPRAARLALDQTNARQIIQRAERKQQLRLENWGQTKVTNASRAQLAGVALSVIGAAVLLGSVGAQQSGVDGAQEFLPIGIGVSVPIVLTGVLFLVGGGVRKRRVREQLGCADAAQMPAHCMPSR